MTFLIQEEFGGVAPRVDERKLAPKLSQVANNCLFERSNLRPLRNPQVTATGISFGTETVYPYAGGWLQFTNWTYVAPSPVPNDTASRLYLADGTTYPQVKSGANTWRLGLPRPDAITASGEAVEEDPDNLLEVEDVYYVVTLVDQFGAEGPPSLPSNVVTRVRDTDVQVTLPSSVSGNYPLGGAAKWRVYRSNTGTDSTSFQYAFESPYSAANGTVTDNIKNSQLQELLPSATWTGPPDDDASRWPDGPLQSLALGSNGIMAGFAARTVYFSEPYLPHAWPSAYSITLRHDIVAIAWISSGLLVVTKGDAVIITGSYPASMTVFAPEKSWACTSAKSLVDMGGWAMYCSADGLVAVTDQNFRLVTEELMTNNQWSTDVPLDGIGGNAEGRYVYFWKQGAEQGAWIFDPTAGVDALTTADIYSDLAYHNTLDNLLYINDGGYLAKFDYGISPLNYTWKSKQYLMPSPTNFAYMEIVADGFPVNVKITAGEGKGASNAVVFEGAVNERISALPHGFEYSNYEIEISGDQQVVLLGLYEDMAEVG